MSEWKKYPIKDVCIGIYDGPHATPPISDKGGIFLGISNITNDGHLDLSSIKYISNDDLPRWTKRVSPQKGDIVFSYEATLNLYAIIPEGFHGCLGRRMALIRTDRTKVDNKFLFYYFFSKRWRDVIAERTITGSTVDRIPIATFPTFPVELPSIETQHRIATILSRYDSLIENYQKQIKLLEEAAQRLYKEWFIDLHFPGHENTNIIDGVPEGWEKKSVGELAEIKSGYAFKSKDWQTTGCPVVKIKDIDGTFVSCNSLDCVSQDITKNASNYLLAKGDIVIAMTGATIGKIGLTTQEGLYTNQRVGKFFIKKDVMMPFLYCFFKNQSTTEMVIKISSSSSAQPNISGKQLTDFTFIANEEILVSFGNKTMFYFKQMIELQSQLRLLTEARDRLLPKLISGEIEV